MFAVVLGSGTGSVRLFRISVLLALAQGAAAQASAQIEDSFKSRPPAVTPVYQMPRPGYDAPKFDIGGFLVAPSFSEILAGDDNIFASDKRQASDLIFTNGEELAIQSQWSRNGAQLRLYHSHDLYADHPAENANTYGVEGSFRFDIAKGGVLEINTGFVQQPQKRNSTQADSLSLARRVYNTMPAIAGYAQDWGRWHNHLEAGLTQTAYISNVDAARSAIQSHYSDRLSFALTGDAWPFLQVSYSTQNWRLNGPLRNFDTLTAIAGMSVQLTDVVDAELGGGVLRQHYVFPGFQDLVTPTFSGHLTWNIRPLTSLSASASQAVTGLESFCGTGLGNPACSSPSINGNQRGALEVTSAKIEIQHEFWHDILGEARFRFEQDKFDPVDLTDRNYSVNLGARFLLNRNMELDISYIFNTRTANQNILLYNSGAYLSNTVSMTLKAAM